MTFTKTAAWPRRFKVRRISTRGSVVYIIAAPESGRYKIGRAKDPHRRLLALQIGSSIELKLVAHTNLSADGIDPWAMERTLHRWLRAYRSHGEWFEAPRQRIILAWHQVAGSILEQELIGRGIIPASGLYIDPRDAPASLE